MRWRIFCYMALFPLLGAFYAVLWFFGHPRSVSLKTSSFHLSVFAPFQCRSRCKPESHLGNSVLLLIQVPNQLSLSRLSLPKAGLHFGVGGFRMIGYEAEIF